MRLEHRPSESERYFEADDTDPSIEPPPGLRPGLPVTTSGFRRGSRSVGIPGLLATAAAGGALFASMWAAISHAPLEVDRRAFDLLATTRGSALARGVELLALVGPPFAGLFVLLLLVLLAARRRWLVAEVIVAGYPLVAIAVHVAKSTEARPRPRHSLIEAGGYSFPSAQAALSIGLLAIAVAIAGMVGRRAGMVVIAAAGLLIALIGALMVAVRVHYLTDVLAGWGLGIAVFALTVAAAIALDAPRDRGDRDL